MSLQLPFQRSCISSQGGSKTYFDQVLSVCSPLYGITLGLLRWIKALGQPHETDPNFIMLWAACCSPVRGTHSTITTDMIVQLIQASWDVAVDDQEHPTTVQLSFKSSNIPEGCSHCHWKHAG